MKLSTIKEIEKLQDYIEEVESKIFGSDLEKEDALQYIEVFFNILKRKIKKIKCN